MHETPPVSGVAALIADPTRATMLSLLMDGAPPAPPGSWPAPPMPRRRQPATI